MAFLQNKKRLMLPTVLLGVFVLSFLLRFADLGRRGRGECRVWFLDVGQGDAEFIETPNGMRLLVDGGPDRSILTKLGQILPPWDRRIDALVLSHSDADHVTGFPSVLEHYHVGTVYESGILGKSGPAHAFARFQVPRVLVKAGDAFQLGGASMEVLAPADAIPGSVPDLANTFSLVLRLSCGGHSVLLVGDLPAERERRIIPLQPKADVLKIAHHGSLTSSDPAFLEAVHPSAAVIEVGAHNTFGHPHAIILERLNKRGIRLFRTDRDGDILFRASGGRFTLEPRPLPF